MKFHQLRNSIELNAKEDPSVYMALCLVESMFRDFKDETGADVYQAPIGDDTFSTKLIWLCRMINKIYKEHDNEIQRNKEKLEQMVRQMSDVESSLAEYAKYASLVKEQEAQNEKRRIELEQVQADYARCCLENQEMETSIQALQDEKDSLIQNHAAMESQQKILQSKVREYKEISQGIEKKLQELDKQLEESRREHDSLKDECSKMENSRDSVVYDISRLTLIIESSRKELLKKQGEYDRKKQDAKEAQERVAKIDQQIHETVEQLDEAQNINQSLEQEKIPELNKLLEVEIQKKEMLSSEADVLVQQKQDLSQEILVLKDRIAQNEEDIEIARAEKKQLEDQKDQLVKIKKELSGLTGDEMISRINSLKKQAGKLEQIRDGLWETTERITKVTGSSPVSSTSSLDKEMKLKINALEECLGEISDRLLECANSFHLEEQR